MILPWPGASIQNMKRIIQFSVSRGEKFYVADGVNVPIVTQGQTLDELMDNIREATALHFEGEKAADLEYAKNPAILASIEV